MQLSIFLLEFERLPTIKPRLGIDLAKWVTLDLCLTSACFCKLSYDVIGLS